MKHHRYAVIVVVALAGAGCSDLPSHDDPRDYEDPSGGNGPKPDASVPPPSGSCSSVEYASCDRRTQSQCNGGCVIATVCHSSTLEMCAAIQNADTCDTTRYCSWSSGKCRTFGGTTCDLNESQTACNRDADLFQCAWGNACSGTAKSCFEWTTQADCTASFGCKWTLD